jgi:dienelactone hydrolase
MAVAGDSMFGRAIASESDKLVPTIDERLNALERAAPLTMQFKGATANEALKWQADFRAKLDQLLGPYQPPKSWDCVLERRVELPEFVREERVLTSPGLAPLPFFLLRPKVSEKPYGPAMLAIHGHGTFGHETVCGVDDTPEHRAEIERFRYDYGRKLAEHGYIVAAPCLTPFGRRLGEVRKTVKYDPCTKANMELQYLGKLLIAENLRDILWTFEYLAHHEAVDADRIGAAGLSLGGRMTMMAAAVEPRIRVATMAGALNCLQERTLHGSIAGCQLIPGLFEYGDVPEISALIAPRHCLWECGAADPHVPADWIEPMLQRQGSVYSALGVADRLTTDRWEGGHQWHGDVAYPLLAKVLGGRA